MKLLPALLPAALLLFAGCKSTEDVQTADVQTTAFLGNEACPMSGKPVDKAVSVESNGENVYFCCPMCAGKAAGHEAEMVAKAYAHPTAVGNATCPISGHDVDGTSAATWQGHEVGLCCGDCAAKFAENPAGNTAKAMGVN